MTSPYAQSSAATYNPNWDTLARYYTELYYEYEKAGNSAGMKAAYEAGEAARAKSDALAVGRSPSDASSGLYASSSAPLTAYTPLAPEYSSFNDYYCNTGFADIEAQTQSLYNAQIQSSVNALAGQKKNVEQGAEELSRQAYIAYLRSRETLPQQLAALGYNGGLSESRQVALESGWQDRRNQIGLESQSALQAIDSAISDAYSKGQLALAGQLTTIRSQAQGQWSDYMRRQEEAALENYWKQVALENENYWKQTQLNYNKTQDMHQEVVRQQELAYQKSRDQTSDTRWETQFGYQQTQDKAASDWQNLMFEYQQKQDEIQNAIKQQQLMLQKLEAARKAAAGQ